MVRPEKTDLEAESLRERVAELEAEKETRDQRIAVQDEKLAAQDKTIGELYSTSGQAERAERAEPQPRLRLPTDAVNSVLSAAAAH